MGWDYVVPVPVWDASMHETAWLAACMPLLDFGIMGHGGMAGLVNGKTEQLFCNIDNNICPLPGKIYCEKRKLVHYILVEFSWNWWYNIG